MENGTTFDVCELTEEPLFTLTPPLRCDWREHFGDALVAKGDIPENYHQKSGWIPLNSPDMPDRERFVRQGIHAPLLLEPTPKELDDITLLFICNTLRKKADETLEAFLKDSFTPQDVCSYKHPPLPLLQSSFGPWVKIEPLPPLRTADGKQASVFRVRDDATRYFALHAYIAEKDSITCIILESRARYKKSVKSPVPKPAEYYAQVFARTVASYRWGAAPARKKRSYTSFLDRWLEDKDPKVVVPRITAHPLFRIRLPEEGWKGQITCAYHRNMGDGHPFYAPDYNILLTPIEESPLDQSYIATRWFLKKDMPDASLDDFFTRIYGEREELPKIRTAEGQEARIFQQQEAKTRLLNLEAVILEQDRICSIVMHSYLAYGLLSKYRHNVSQPLKDTAFYQKGFYDTVASYRWIDG